jgi:hypothetical protein
MHGCMRLPLCIYFVHIMQGTRDSEIRKTKPKFYICHPVECVPYSYRDFEGEFAEHVYAHVYNVPCILRYSHKALNGFPKEMLERVVISILSRLLECIERHGGRLQSVIFNR